MTNNIKGVLIIAAAIVLVGIVYCATNYMGTRYRVDTIDKTTYRIDRHTGEMSIIKPNGVITKVKEQRKVMTRELTESERKALNGRGGPYSDQTKFETSIYNGNNDIVVTELDICVIFTNGEETVSRDYKETVKILPKNTASVYFTIISPGFGFEFKGWYLPNARGYDKPIDDIIED